ncbi:MAG: hypothetical protein QXZ70_05935 [Candidatus Bathyarchaeia archaeon]
MEFNKIAELIFSEMTPKLENNNGVSIFAKERAKFEGWLKVELCESLLKHFQNVIPERNRIDVMFGNWAVELKTVNTNYRFRNIKNKSRPITKNIEGIISDIEKLKKSNCANKAVLFVTFPATHNHKNWQSHLRKIPLKEIKFREFKFRNGVLGVIYFGLV